MQQQKSTSSYIRRNDVNHQNDRRKPVAPPSQKAIDSLFDIFLRDIDEKNQWKQCELEVRFGTKRGRNAFIKKDYDNVVRRLLSAGFSPGQRQEMLRINNDHMRVRGAKAGTKTQSNIRTELTGMSSIQKYCQTDMLPDDLYGAGVVFNLKTDYQSGGEYVRPLEFGDFNFRIKLDTEQKLPFSDPKVKGISNTRDWVDLQKTFRYINRVSFRHPDLPFQVDMSMVKSSKMPSYNIKDSQVFHQPVTYEIEIEMINEMVLDRRANDGSCSTNAKTYGVLRKGIQLVLAGLQGTNFPVSYAEHDLVMAQYMKMIHGSDWGKNAQKGWKKSSNINTSDFIGPSSVTLQMKNIVPEGENSNAVNIREQYTVTEKADGDRKLLYVAPGGKVYLITTAMAPEFTGMVVRSEQWKNTLLDGEHIALDKDGKFINLYAAFDIYFCKGIDVRGYHFMDLENQAKSTTSANAKYRHSILARFMIDCTYKSVIGDEKTPMQIQKKKFYGSATNSIFDECAKVNATQYEYETDGLIFTPANLGVGLDSPTKKKAVNRKITWQNSFKWKPPQYNTIDFLVDFEKDQGGIKKRWNQASGNCYQTMRLRVGYDPNKNGYINPCGDMMNDNLPSYEAGARRWVGDIQDNEPRQYIPALFFPTSPYDNMAHVSNRFTSGNDTVLTEEGGEVIADNTIVEFRYEIDEDVGWRWIPLRVRHDKTEEYHKCIQKFRNDYTKHGWKFGNDYSVANNNWHSIHNRVTEAMIYTGNDIPHTAEDADIYYNTNGGRERGGQSQTRALRDFHNYVKRTLIAATTKKKDKMIDYAVGKGGDMPKWIYARLGFVYGLDISQDNIEHKKDGCCARYLNNCRQYRIVPECLFVPADTGKLIHNGDAFGPDGKQGRAINEALFGKGGNISDLLGKRTRRMYGWAKDGFDIGSIQFAIHYMCKDKETFHNFLRNVSETVKLEGRFIATCYDGSEIIKKLSGVANGEKVTLNRNGRKIWEITKRYDGNDFNVDDTCLGKTIEVFQESINKVFEEYLVHPKYLEEQFANYGFVLTDEKDVMGKNQTENIYGTGTFEDLYKNMIEENGQHGNSSNRGGRAKQMCFEEKQISFLNRYYVFKKTTRVDAKKMYEFQMGIGSEVGIDGGKSVAE